MRTLHVLPTREAANLDRKKRSVKDDSGNVNLSVSIADIVGFDGHIFHKVVIRDLNHITLRLGKWAMNFEDVDLGGSSIPDLDMYRLGGPLYFIRCRTAFTGIVSRASTLKFEGDCHKKFIDWIRSYKNVEEMKPLHMSVSLKVPIKHYSLQTLIKQMLEDLRDGHCINAIFPTSKMMHSVSDYIIGRYNSSLISKKDKIRAKKRRGKDKKSKDKSGNGRENERESKSEEKVTCLQTDSFLRTGNFLRGGNPLPTSNPLQTRKIESSSSTSPVPSISSGELSPPFSPTSEQREGDSPSTHLEGKDKPVGREIPTDEEANPRERKGTCYSLSKALQEALSLPTLISDFISPAPPEDSPEPKTKCSSIPPPLLSPTKEGKSPVPPLSVRKKTNPPTRTTPVRMSRGGGLWKCAPRFICIDEKICSNVDFFNDAIMLEKINAVFMCPSSDKNDILKKRLRISIDDFFETQYVIYQRIRDEKEPERLRDVLQHAEMVHDNSFVNGAKQYNCTIEEGEDEEEALSTNM